MAQELYTLTYMDRRGAGRIYGNITAEQALRKLPTVKAEATLRDSTGRTVGGVEDWHDMTDDRRVRWIWWAEPDL